MLDPCRALDHLLIGAPTLETGMAWLEERTGVRATIGGSHPGQGTWNALASLGPTQYLEIIAPDPGQPGVATFYIPGLRDWREPRVATWAAQGSQLATRFMATLPSSFSCDAPRPGARVRRDGTRLAWTLAFPQHREHGRFGGALPFFIEWESLEGHPSRTTPGGLTLSTLSFGHPEPALLRDALRALGLDCPVEPAAAASIHVEIETPRGPVAL